MRFTAFYLFTKQYHNHIHIVKDIMIFCTIFSPVHDDMEQFFPVTRQVNTGMPIYQVTTVASFAPKRNETGMLAEASPGNSHSRASRAPCDDSQQWQSTAKPPSAYDKRRQFCMKLMAGIEHHFHPPGRLQNKLGL